MKNDTPDLPIFPPGTLLRIVPKKTTEEQEKEEDGICEVGPDFTFFFEMGSHDTIWDDNRKPCYYFSSEFDKDVVMYLGQGYISDHGLVRHYIEVLHPRLGVLCWHTNHTYRLESTEAFLGTFEQINTESDDSNQ